MLSGLPSDPIQTESSILPLIGLELESDSK